MDSFSFSSRDIEQLAAHGISHEQALMQLKQLRSGFPALKLVKHAEAGREITVTDHKQAEAYAALFDHESADYSITKFVPASGAATRMFKSLFAAADTLIKDPGAALPKSVELFINKIDCFAFHDALAKKLNEKGASLEQLIGSGNFLPIIQTLLSENGLNFSSLPKALIPFHLYPDGPRTAMEEQVHEGIGHALNPDHELSIHFSISPEHLQAFENISKKIIHECHEKGIEVNMSHSFQSAATDTIALDENGLPARHSDGSLMLRPGGHGALLMNLQALDADIIFIKNIDNVVPDHLRDTTILYKKVLGGILMNIVEQLNGFLEMLDDGNVDSQDLDLMLDFASEKLFVDIPAFVAGGDELEKMDFLFQIFHRPVRVCGMVKNEGEPGGGPFVVEKSDGSHSLQIVESSQVNIGEGKQKTIFEASTHFNPVDIVCCIRDFRGDKFELNDFSDPETGFVASKSAGGREIKALELPGLWNGAMSDWNTVFVEVPIETFHPVKEVIDLLRPTHQPPA